MNQDDLDNLAETFVYVDLLSAIIAILVLYEVRDVRAERAAAIMEEKKLLNSRIDDLETQIRELREKLEEFSES